jgi:serine protease Do
MTRLSLPAIVLLAASSCCFAQAPGRVSRVTPVVRAYRKASPAVVNISAEKIVRAGMGFFGGRWLFDDIFPSPLVRRKSIGSGVVIHPSGYIVTNSHVVSRAEKITIQMVDKSRHVARVISSDSDYDLAVLKVDWPKGRVMPHLRLGRSDDLMVGETVIAIGNPLEYSSTLTTGVISATNRTLKFGRGVEFRGLIQTDAPINPGNSGGPLLNIRGELIGINTAIRADAQNIGFAIAVDTVAEQMGKLLDFERINRVVFGVAMERKHDKDGDALYVTEVRPGTPAAAALKKGDRIVSLNGRETRQISQFFCEMMGTKGGRKVFMKIIRGSKSLDVAVTVASKPKPDGKALARRLLGVTLRVVTRELAANLRLGTDWGLVVVGIDEGSPADRLDIRLKDVLFQVERLYVKDLDALGMMLEDVKPGETIRIGGVRGNLRYWATVRTAGRTTGKKPPADR